MNELTDSLVVWLRAFFGLSADEDATNDGFELAQKAFRSNPNLRLATKKEDTLISSAHTGTAHNTDTADYIPVRDKRNEDIALILKPVTHKKNIVSYLVVLDTAKVSTTATCKAFAEVYMTKSLKLKKSWDSLCASVFARGSGDDLMNNARGKAARKADQRDELLALARPFLALPEKLWLDILPSIEERDETLAEVITELRSEQA